MRIPVRATLLIGLAFGVGGCDWAKPKQAPGQKSAQELASERADRTRKACASEATYDRLKEVVFDEAARIRNGDPRNLDPVAAGAVVRMERPLVKSRDDALNVTVCTGHFILELPPGTENAFDGKRRAEADVEYSAQAAADGSGLVYQMDGAEPIIYRLASFGVAPGAMAARPAPVPQPAPPPAAPIQTAAAAPPPAARPSSPAVRPPPPRPAPPPAPSFVPAQAAGAPRPAFNCRYAHTRTERLVCNSPSLAANDRAMASVYYGAVASADPATKDRIRASRNGFLRRRERCGDDEGCVARTYRERIAEIRGMTGE
jgi:hypothetical protein